MQALSWKSTLLFMRQLTARRGKSRYTQERPAFYEGKKRGADFRILQSEIREYVI